MRGNIGIQAKRGTKQHAATKKKPAIKGGKQREGGGQSTTPATPQNQAETKQRGGEEPGGSRGQRENMTHPQQEEYERALAESREGPGIIR